QGCVKKITNLLLEVNHVQNVEVDLTTKLVSITGGHDVCIEKKLQDNHYVFTQSLDNQTENKNSETPSKELNVAAKEPHTQNNQPIKQTIFSVKDMTCSSCVSKIEKAISQLEDVQETQVNLVDKTVSVTGQIN